MVTSSKNYFVTRIYPKLLIAGAKICHQREDRSFHAGIRKWPVCARCSGIYLALLPALVIASVLASNPILGAFLLLPLVIDGVTQLFTRYESNNALRFITGVLWSAGWALLVLWGIRSLIPGVNAG